MQYIWFNKPKKTFIHSMIYYQKNTMIDKLWLKVN